jgi:hypothetical protein
VKSGRRSIARAKFFFNTSPLDMKKLMGDQDHIKENLFAYMQAFSPSVRDIFESFDFHTQIDRLAKRPSLVGNRRSPAPEASGRRSRRPDGADAQGGLHAADCARATGWAKARRLVKGRKRPKHIAGGETRLSLE